MKNTPPNWFALLLAMLLFSVANSTSASFYPFITHADFHHANITTYTQYAVDKEGIDIDTMLSGKHSLDFTSTITDNASLGFTNDAWWVRFAIKNDAAAPQHLLVGLTPSQFNHVEAYEVADGQWQAIKSHEPTQQFFTNKLRLPMLDFPLFLPAGAEYQYYFKIEPERFFTYQFELSKPILHLENSRKYIFLPILLTGFLLAVAFYRLALFLHSRRVTSLYLALYLITVVLSSTIAFNSNGVFVEIALAHLALIFFLLLCKGIIHTAQYSARANSALNGIILFLIASAASATVIPPSTSFMVLGGLYLFSILLLFALSIVFVAQRIPNALLLLLTVTPTIACLPLIIATQRGSAAFPINSAVPILLVAAIKGFILNVGLHRSFVQHLHTQHKATLRQRTEEVRTQTHKDTLSRLDQEIRTPMTAVLGMAEILTDTPLTNNQREYLGSIQAAGHNLLHILNNVLEYASLDEHSATSAHSSVNLADLLHSVASLFTDRAAEKNVVLLHYFHNTVPPYVLIDPLRLKQILTNLTSSALRHATAGELILEISMDPLQHQHVRFELSGSALAQTNNLFMPFTTEEPPRAGDEVNLSVARQLVEHINGRSGVRLNNQGNILWFTLPLPADPSNKQRVLNLHTFNSKTLLIVDSSQTVTRILRRQTLGWGLLVNVSHDAREALASIRNQAAMGEPFDAVLFDGELPGMGGLQFARRLHDQMHQHPMPLLLMMGGSQQEVSANALRQSSIFGMLPKPLSAQHLYELLKQGFAADRSYLTPDLLLSDKKALLAMPSLDSRAHLTSLLTSLGANVYTAIDADEILEHAIHTPYELIVLSSTLATHTLVQTIRHVGAMQSAIVVLGPNADTLAKVAYHNDQLNLTHDVFCTVVHAAFAYIDSEQG